MKNLTPKERAKELVDVFLIEIYPDSLISMIGRANHLIQAKNMAMVCVKEVIKETEMIHKWSNEKGFTHGVNRSLDFNNQVINEIINIKQ